MAKDIITAESLRDIVEQHITIEGGVATFDHKAIEKEAFARFDVSKEDVTKAYDAVAATANAVGLVFSEHAQDYLKENNDTDQVTGELKIGGEKEKYAVNRSSQVRNPTTGEVTEVKGALKMTRTLTTRNTEYSNIKQLAKERAIRTL